MLAWQRAQMALLPAQSMPLAKIAEVTFTSTDRVRDVIHNFNADGFEGLYLKCKGGRPRTLTLPERRESKHIPGRLLINPGVRDRYQRGRDSTRWIWRHVREDETLLVTPHLGDLSVEVSATVGLS